MAMGDPAPSIVEPHVVAGAPALEVDGVSKRYGRTLALDGVGFSVGRNERFALLGPNGAGKTTLMHILCTLLAPDGGAARIAGFDVVRQPRLARSRLGVVFQEPSLDDRLSVRENLELHGLVFGVPRAARRQRIGQMLALVELEDWADKPARSMSSGMKRRLEIARALIHDAEILLLDEPTVGLDVQTRERIWGYVRRLQAERGITVVVTTHYIEEVESCDRVCVIDHGKVLAEGSPDALKREHGLELLRVVPREAADRERIRARFAERITAERDGELVLASDEAFVERFLAEFGLRLLSLSRERPSLESVFLTLTGREIRDGGAGPREQTRAFGRRGGEHTG
jgi:ABC-2 type transport system ATP-binding protein